MWLSCDAMHFWKKTGTNDHKGILKVIITTLKTKVCVLAILLAVLRDET